MSLSLVRRSYGNAQTMSVTSRLRELHDDLNVVGFSLQSVAEFLRRNTPANEFRQPRAIGSRQEFTCLVPVPFIGIHAAKDHIVFEDRGRRDIGAGCCGDDAAVSDSGQTHNSTGPDRLDRVGNQLANPRAFNDRIRLKPDRFYGTAVVGRSQSSH